MNDESQFNGRPTYTAQAIKSDTESMVFLGNPHIDNLVSIVIALGAEIWESRQRMLIIERLLEKEGRVTEEMIEQYVASDEEFELWEAKKAEMTQRVYSVLARDTSKAKPFNSPFPY
ncbi:MAG: hypothetical protein JJU27_07140 [Gammaproteobacteria bacterium]|nr:hypothetical protein [Gammaproteobacteria bacterium]